MNDGETITKAELAEALGRHAQIPYHIMADELINDIKAHREPMFVHRDVVQDAKGDVWVFDSNYATGGWQAPGVSGAVGFAIPARPLRRLLPEGPQAAKVDHGQVLDELTAHTRLPRQEAVDLAWRICKLLGGECI